MVITSKSSENASEWLCDYMELYLGTLKYVLEQQHAWHKNAMLTFRTLNKELRYHLGQVYQQPFCKGG